MVKCGYIKFKIYKKNRRVYTLLFVNYFSIQFSTFLKPTLKQYLYYTSYLIILKYIFLNIVWKELKFWLFDYYYRKSFFSNSFRKPRKQFRNFFYVENIKKLTSDAFKVLFRFYSGEFFARKNISFEQIYATWVYIYIYIEYNVSFLRIILVSTRDQQQYEKNGQKQNEKYEITTLISINTSLARFYIYYFSKSLWK